MKFSFHVSPSLKGKLTTQSIMRDLTIGLCAVFVCSLMYYGNAYGWNYAGQEILLMACALVTTFVCEALYALITKQKVLPFIKTSFGWVTAIILTLMCPVTITPYALIIATAFAIIFGRLVFGGFGNNIFNPAAVGRAVIFAAFATASTDLVTGATPLTTLSTTYHELPANGEMLQTFLDQFGGWTGLLLGTHPGAMGETFALAILLVGAFLIWRKVIDWRTPVVYLGSIAVLTACIAIFSGLESWNGIPAFLWYPALHLLTGGVIFGAVFMLTEPVTNPTSPAGRVVFALGAAVLTVLIRLKGNLPEGCLYSILLMNMFTPMIESALDGKQLEVKKKAYIISGCLAALGLALTLYISASVEPVAALASSATSAATESASSSATDESTDSAATEESTDSAATEESADSAATEETEEASE
jgi:electron transport complex protein RnfD